MWVVDAVCQVTVQVQNLLPTELVVHSLVLHTEGCDFEAVPVRLNLAAASNPSNSLSVPTIATSQNSGSQKDLVNDSIETDQPTSSTAEIALIGVPRSEGTLRVTGYSYVVFDMETRCYLQSNQELSVQVLPALPKLQLQTSLKRAPVVDEDDAGIGEATIFSGQT